MKIEIDKNNLLTIANENIPQTKEYTYHVSGYTFSDFDKGIIVLHKKALKIINLKNLGDNMSIIYIANRPLQQLPFEHEAYIQARYLFESFDEETGKTGYFIPKCSEKDLPRLNDILHQLGRKDSLIKTEKGCMVQATSPKQNPEYSLSFLLGLIHLYGKLDIKNGELLSIKAHIPLFGQFLKYEQLLDNMKNTLAAQGMFINTSIQKNNEGIVYQISCNDYEILQNIAQYHKGIENINKIPKYDLMLDVKQEIITFVQTNPDIPNNGKEAVIKQIQEGTIKLLTK